MLPTVGDEVGALTKGFSTHLALVRLLTYKQKAGEKGCERGNILLMPDQSKHTLGLEANQGDSFMITKEVILTKNMQLGAPKH